MDTEFWYFFFIINILKYKEALKTLFSKSLHWLLENVNKNHIFD